MTAVSACRASWYPSINKRNCVCTQTGLLPLSASVAEALLAAQSCYDICSKRCNGLQSCSGLCGVPAGCDYAAVERVNAEHLHPLLSSLVKLPFFRYFKVSMAFAFQEQGCLFAGKR